MWLHQTLSPNCLFVLAVTYSKQANNNNSLPLRIEVVNNFRSSIDVAIGRQWQKANLAKPSVSPYAQVSHREASFHCAPSGPPPNLCALVEAGFYYEDALRSVTCFYCHRRTDIPVEVLQSTNPWPIPEYHDDCVYHRQKNDEDPLEVHRSRKFDSSIRSLFSRIGSSFLESAQCGWCEKEPVRYAAFPCKHPSMCKTCSETRFCCPWCFTRLSRCVEIYL